MLRKVGFDPPKIFWDIPNAVRSEEQDKEPKGALTVLMTAVGVRDTVSLVENTVITFQAPWTLLGNITDVERHDCYWEPWMPSELLGPLLTAKHLNRRWVSPPSHQTPSCQRSARDGYHLPGIRLTVKNFNGQRCFLWTPDCGRYVVSCPLWMPSWALILCCVEPYPVLSCSVRSCSVMSCPVVYLDAMYPIAKGSVLLLELEFAAE